MKTLLFIKFFGDCQDTYSLYLLEGNNKTLIDSINVPGLPTNEEEDEILNKLIAMPNILVDYCKNPNDFHVIILNF